MGRHTRISMPQTLEHLKTHWKYLQGFTEVDKTFKARHKENHNKRHKVVELPDLLDACCCRLDQHQETTSRNGGNQHSSPRSYIVDSPTGKVRRNRSQLKLLPPSTLLDGEQESNSQPERICRLDYIPELLSWLRIDWTYET